MTACLLTRLAAFDPSCLPWATWGGGGWKRCAVQSSVCHETLPLLDLHKILLPFPNLGRGLGSFIAFPLPVMKGECFDGERGDLPLW